VREASSDSHGRPQGPGVSAMGGRVVVGSALHPSHGGDRVARARQPRCAVAERDQGAGLELEQRGELSGRLSDPAGAWASGRSIGLAGRLQGAGFSG
jgi:hypothetical protein